PAQLARPGRAARHETGGDELLAAAEGPQDALLLVQHRLVGALQAAVLDVDEVVVERAGDAVRLDDHGAGDEGGHPGDHGEVDVVVAAQPHPDDATARRL